MEVDPGVESPRKECCDHPLYPNLVTATGGRDWTSSGGVRPDHERHRDFGRGYGHHRLPQ